MKLLTIGGLLIIAGCSTAPSQSYRPANYGGSPWNIVGDLNQLSGSLVIKVNNQMVIQDRVNILTGNGEFQGSYEGKPVTASCMMSMGFFNNPINCFVFVSGERAATLTF